MDIESYIAWIVKYYLPAMIANASPLLVKGDKVIDKGRLFIDGKPILGSHKTWEGFAIGVINSYLTGSAVGIAFRDPCIQVLSVVAGVSSMLGDLVGAFIKRRLGLKPGRPLPIIDQLSFALMTTLSYLLLGVVDVISRPDYVLSTLALIFILHVAANNIAYMLGVKETRW
ncbi:CDP-archaeol synthase [Desulfurococcus amylolyticus]|uniref:CDP-archaeol synthase n=1 Tax=Desulfurococcus amylolyticus TaxID=94694 RepID=UPI0023F1C0D8|nr:CDP-archaeol synthase [Desulfurococcus amylolyticus]